MALKKYRVAGTSTVLGKAPGTTFEASLTPEQEAPLLAIGALEVVAKKDASEHKSGSKSDPSPSSPRRG